MKRLILTSVLLTLVLALVTFFAAKSVSAKTYYVSVSGSDSADGTSKSTAWAHLPGMPSATGIAGSYSAVAGDTFILKGCDVWYNTSGTSNFPLALSHGDRAEIP